jgi:hypothetical protein
MTIQRKLDDLASAAAKALRGDDTEKARAVELFPKSLAGREGASRGSRHRSQGDDANARNADRRRRC